MAEEIRIGAVFGTFTVIAQATTSRRGNARWRVKCGCGYRTALLVAELRRKQPCYRGCTTEGS